MRAHLPCAHRAAGKAGPALGSFPGMGFLGEVPAGKGCSLNRWGRPIVFLEGNSSDCPLWPPPKWALCPFQTFLYGHNQSWHTTSSTAREPTPARYWTGKLEGRGGVWDDAVAPAEPGGASWGLRGV